MHALKSIFKSSKLAFLFLFISLMACRSDPFDEIITVSNIRIIQVNATSDAVLIGNFGGAQEDISSYWLCIRNNYVQLNTLVTGGGLNLANRQFVAVNIALNDNSSDVALYSSDDFSSPEAMVDFMQYGADIGSNGRVEVAISKGIWEDGTFVGNGSPYTYNGDGTQTKVGAWSGTVDQSGPVANIRLLQVDPSAGTITLKNFGAAAQDVGNYLICNERGYAIVGTLTNAQDLILEPDETLVLERTLSTSASDVALYANDAFESANAMLDFMQYGADIGNAGRIGVAVTKGIWTNGTFVSGGSPFDYTGDGTDTGAGAWTGN